VAKLLRGTTSGWYSKAWMSRARPVVHQHRTEHVRHRGVGRHARAADTDEEPTSSSKSSSFVARSVGVPVSTPGINPHGGHRRPRRTQVPARPWYPTEDAPVREQWVAARPEQPSEFRCVVNEDKSTKSPTSMHDDPHLVERHQRVLEKWTRVGGSEQLAARERVRTTLRPGSMNAFSDGAVKVVGNENEPARSCLQPREIDRVLADADRNRTITRGETRFVPNGRFANVKSLPSAPAPNSVRPCTRDLKIAARAWSRSIASNSALNCFAEPTAPRRSMISKNTVADRSPVSVKICSNSPSSRDRRGYATVAVLPRQRGGSHTLLRLRDSSLGHAHEPHAALRMACTVATMLSVRSAMCCTPAPS